jgi:hypothetical protein
MIRFINQTSTAPDGVVTIFKVPNPSVPCFTFNVIRFLLLGLSPTPRREFRLGTTQPRQVGLLGSVYLEIFEHQFWNWLSRTRYVVVITSVLIFEFGIGDMDLSHF